MFGNYACPHCINDYDVLKWPIKGVHKHAIHERDIMRNEWLFVSEKNVRCTTCKFGTSQRKTIVAAKPPRN
jgi:hypothetical protein